jgi:hypothetical protein
MNARVAGILTFLKHRILLGNGIDEEEAGQFLDLDRGEFFGPFESAKTLRSLLDGRGDDFHENGPSWG